MHTHLFLSLFSIFGAFADASQPSAPKAKAGKLRELVWGDLNFLATTDTHGWHAGHLQEPQYSADWGDFVSFAKHMQEKADEKGVDLILLDTGDRIEGNGLSDASDPKGMFTREIFKTLDIDLVTTGNHELYKANSSNGEWTQMIPHYGSNYVTSNVEIVDPETGELKPMGTKFRKFTTRNRGYRIKAFGFLFNFKGNFHNTVVTPVEDEMEKEWFQREIRDPDLDLILIFGHAPVRGSPEFLNIHRTIRAVNPTIPIQFFGGHTHIRDFAVYDRASAGLESGRYCETVGWLSISNMPAPGSLSDKELSFSRRYIDFNRYGFQRHANKSASTFDTKAGKQISVMIGKMRQHLGLDRLYGCAPRSYFMFRAPYPGPNSLYSLLAEEILPKMVHNAHREDKARLIYINTGSQRFDIFKGPFTYDTSFIVSPFTSNFRYIPDVPYKIAKHLLKVFNADKRPWILNAEEKERLEKIMQGMQPPELQYADSKLVEMRIQGGEQIVLKENENLIPGYTTFDDHGRDGDDTVHSRLPMHRVGNCVEARVNFPETEDEVEEEGMPVVVDVVFLDFIEDFVLQGLKFLGGKYTKEDAKQYMSEDETLTKMMLDYASKYWSKEC